MTESDLRAIGWVVTRETLVDIVRGAFGAPRRIDPSVFAALAEQWSALENVRSEERPASPLASLSSIGASLSSRTADALDAFVERIVAACPERFGPAALRRRCRTGLAQAAAGCLGGILLSCAGLAPDTLLADAALVLLAMGLWYSVTTLQVWRTYQLVNGLASRAQRSRPQMISQPPGGRDNARRSGSNRRV